LVSVSNNQGNDSVRVTVSVSFDDNKQIQLLAGEQNSNLKVIEKQLDVRVHLRGNQFTISGARADAEIAERLLNELAELIRGGYPLYGSDVLFAIQILTTFLSLPTRGRSLPRA
jgi:phosphate starvation-inducible PhoH-like protein